MRVSTQQITDRVLFYLNSHTERLQQLQTQLASGKRIARASEDPSSAALSLTWQIQSGQVEQYQQNIEDGLGWARATDHALGNANDVLRQARTLAISGARDSLEISERQALAMQARGLRDSLLRVANSDFDGRKLFGGTVTNSNPLSLAADGSAVYAGNSEAITRQISKDFQQTINVTGDNAFNVGSAAVPGTPDAFAVLAGIMDDIENGNVLNLSSTRLQQIDAIRRHVLDAQADVGVRVNTLEMGKNRLDNMGAILRERLSETEDVNLPEVIAHLQTEENAYEAALAATARLVPPSLLDFLR